MEAGRRRPLSFGQLVLSAGNSELGDEIAVPVPQDVVLHDTVVHAPQHDQVALAVGDRPHLVVADAGGAVGGGDHFDPAPALQSASAHHQAVGVAGHPDRHFRDPAPDLVADADGAALDAHVPGNARAPRHQHSGSHPRPGAQGQIGQAAAVAQPDHRRRVLVPEMRQPVARKSLQIGTFRKTRPHRVLVDHFDDRIAGTGAADADALGHFQHRGYRIAPGGQEQDTASLCGRLPQRPGQRRRIVLDTVPFCSRIARIDHVRHRLGIVEYHQTQRLAPARDAASPVVDVNLVAPGLHFGRKPERALVEQMADPPGRLDRQDPAALRHQGDQPLPPPFGQIASEHPDAVAGPPPLGVHPPGPRRAHQLGGRKTVGIFHPDRPPGRGWRRNNRWRCSRRGTRLPSPGPAGRSRGCATVSHPRAAGPATRRPGAPVPRPRLPPAPASTPLPRPRGSRRGPLHSGGPNPFRK